MRHRLPRWKRWGPRRVAMGPLPEHRAVVFDPSLRRARDIVAGPPDRPS